MRLYDFACANGHTTEKFVVYETRTIQCSCGELSHRKLSAPGFKLEGWSGSFPTAHGQFERRHRSQLDYEQKHT